MSKCNTTTLLRPILRETPPNLIAGAKRRHATRDALSTHQCVRRGMNGGYLLHEFHTHVWRMGAMLTGLPRWTTRLGLERFLALYNGSQNATAIK